MPSTLRSLAVLAAWPSARRSPRRAGSWNGRTAATDQKGEKHARAAGDAVDLGEPGAHGPAGSGDDHRLQQGPLRDDEPGKQYFWSGTSSDYVREMSRTRDAAMRERIGNLTGKPAKAGEAAASRSDAARRRSGEAAAGVDHQDRASRRRSPATTRRSTRCGSTATCFEEIWIAPPLERLGRPQLRPLHRRSSGRTAPPCMGKSADAVQRAVPRSPSTAS